MTNDTKAGLALALFAAGLMWVAWEVGAEERMLKRNRQVRADRANQVVLQAQARADSVLRSVTPQSSRGLTENVLGDMLNLSPSDSSARAGRTNLLSEKNCSGRSSTPAGAEALPRRSTHGML
jgi:hypothetical protein